MAASNDGIVIKYDNGLNLPDIVMPLYNPGPDEDSDGGVDTNMQQTKMVGIITPLIKVNNTVIAPTSVVSMTLKCNVTPTVKVVINDALEILNILDTTKQDNSMQVQILPSFDNGYKKINLLFYITRYKARGKEIHIDGIYKVNGLYDNVMKSYGEVTTYEVFDEVAKSLSLGFASNVNGTNDKRWIYNPLLKPGDFLSNEIRYSGDERMILDWWVDFWNNVNLVDIYERTNKIDKDIKVWMMPNRFQNGESVDETKPVEMEACITNSVAFRDFGNYVNDFSEETTTGSSLDGTDRALQFFDAGAKQNDIYKLMNGDSKDDIFMRYEYLGENYSDCKYLLNNACRDMYISKLFSYRIKVSLFQPCFGLMRGNKVNFYWYRVNDMIDEIADEPVDTNNNAGAVDSRTNAYLTEEFNEDEEPAYDKFILDKSVSGQYYISECTLRYRYDGGAYNWWQEMTLVRPQDQREYYEYEEIPDKK